MLDFAIRRCIALVLACCSSLVACASAEDFPPELVRFEPYSKNPVFSAAGEGHWDARIRERGWMLRESDSWKLWYTGYDGTREGQKLLGYATSPDGLVWTRQGEQPLHADDWVEDVMVVREADAYYLFAEGRGDRAHLLKSADGQKWERVGPLDIRRQNGEPIEPGPFGTPTVWHEDGKWLLFYERGDDGVWLAQSSDLLVWTNLQDEPVLTPGPGKYDRYKIALNQIIKHDGRYYAYYHGSGTAEPPRLWTTCVAVSDDLLHWKKYAGNPLFPEGENKSSGILVHDGERFRLYTMHDRVDVHFQPRVKN